MKNAKCKMQNGVSLAALLLCAFALSSCSMISGSRGDIRITSWRLLWKSEAIVFSVVDSNLVASLAVGSSRSDDESIALATAAAVSAAMKGVAP